MRQKTDAKPEMKTPPRRRKKGTATKREANDASLKSDHLFSWSLQRGGGFHDEQAAVNPCHCWFRHGGVLRRNREWTGTENGKPPKTGLSLAAPSVAALPETAQTLGAQHKKKWGTELVCSPDMVEVAGIEPASRTPPDCRNYNRTHSMEPHRSLFKALCKTPAISVASNPNDQLAEVLAFE